MWSIFKEVIGAKTKENGVSEILFNGKVTNDKTEICNLLNKYFSNVGENLTQNLNPSNLDPLQYLSELNVSKFNFRMVTVEEIHSVIKSMSNSVSTTKFDIVPMTIFKKHVEFLGPIITYICNLCLLDGQFPSRLKVAKIVCIFKAGERNLMKNYRPISILPPFGKIIEKIVAMQVYEHFQINSLFCTSQFGFRKNLSTENAVLNLVDYVGERLDAGNFVVGVFLDVAKAFDCIDRQLLLQKLEKYGIRDTELNFFRNYFGGRMQYTAIDDLNSELTEVRKGIAQGSTLGPLMFLIYVNDLVKSSNVLNFTLYADDTSVTHVGKNLDTVISTLNQELQLVATWFNLNKLPLNSDKSQYIIFRTRQKNIPNFFNCSSVKITGNSVLKVSNVKFLGVLVDEFLSFKEHALTVSKKLTKFVHLIKKCKSVLTVSSLKFLYNTLIQPVLLYCISVWGNSSATALKPVKCAQKKIIRSIAGVARRHSTANLFTELYILPVSEAHEYISLILVYKSLNNLSCCDWFISVNGPYNTRSVAAGDLVVPYARTELFRKSCRITAALFYNNLPEGIRNAESYNIFKLKCKKYLLEWN